VVRELSFFGGFKRARQHDACGPRLHGAAGHCLFRNRGSRGSQFGGEGLVFRLCSGERVGQGFSGGSKAGVFFGERGEFFLQGGDVGGAGLEVGDLLFEGFDNGVLVWGLLA
jgi:hypothetical protein